MSGATAVEADGLYVIYRERDLETVALRGTGIVLPEGTWTSLMGPSGSGKSTLVHVLGGLLEPSGGRVVIAGEDITRLPPVERARRRRRRIGIVLQRDNLHPLLDVGGNIALPLRLDGRPAAHIRTRVRELLDGLGLSDRARQPVRQLSGGEAQRVAIAVALAARPTVLLADEITGELDARTAAGVLDLLARARDDQGAAILTVTHNPSVTERADLRLRMRDGIVIE
ncbi:ABC transporter ATP-binding protein [Streptomyces stelliscabiei]|uniref:ABC transporter ATP-binding protein n=1 Tax=Streptomyces stelliscabiei TaxID=146820 RepID=UPI0029B0AC39|nr:ATP-binding cassette domain-containing protein [Streptomyces stelliscabiei]MDX3435764.1 ATP-binding cassette domain-containing protein [Streptomyces stelliscabiei]MDX3621937.1 ATP-binding cassette domain-containing protein [Streptomyces stelliscabiei]